MDHQARIDVNWIQVLAGALAAVSSAVLLSTVGVAGTIIGAAAGSVAATVGGAVYSYYLAASRERVLAARALALQRVTRAQPKASGLSDQSADRSAAESAAQSSAESAGKSEAETAGMDREPGQDSEGPPESEADADEPMSWRKILGGLRWKRIALVSLAIFALAMAAIMAFELMTGRAVSTYTGGTGDDGRQTTIPLGGRDDAKEKPKDVPTPSGSTSDAPSDVAPTEPASGSGPTTSPTEPSTTVTPPGESTSVPPTSDQPGVETSASTSEVTPTGEPTP